jgi:hypothetical protein
MKTSEILSMERAAKAAKIEPLKSDDGSYYYVMVANEPARRHFLLPKQKTFCGIEIIVTKQ